MFNFPVVPVGKKPKSLPAYIVAGNGIFLRKESALGITQTRVTTVGHLPSLEPELEYKLPPIPKKLSAQIAGFLLKVDKVFHCEGALLLCLDKKNKWRIVVPRQDPSGADVKYFVDEDTVPDGWLLAGTVHSHPFNKSSTPSASWTDESDERKIDGVHLVAGSLEHEPKYGAAVVVNGTRFKYANWQDLIVPAEPDMDSVPDEWLDAIEKKKPGAIGQAISKVTSSFSSSYTYVPDYIPKEGETVEQAIARARKFSFEYINEDLAKLGYRLVWSVEELPSGASSIDDGKVQAPINDTVSIGSGGKVTSTLTPIGDAFHECECLVCLCDITSQLSTVGNRLVCSLCLKGSHGSLRARDKKKKNAVKGGVVDTPSGPMKLTPYPEQEVLALGVSTSPGGGKWRGATPIECTLKHKGRPCPVDAKNPEVTNCGCHCKPCREHLVGSYDASQVQDLPPINDDSGMPFGGEWAHTAPPADDECHCTTCHKGCYAYLGLTRDESKTMCDDCQRGSHYLEDGGVSNPPWEDEGDEDMAYSV